MKIGICIIGLLSLKNGGHIHRVDGGSTYAKHLVEGIANLDTKNDYVIFVDFRDRALLAHIQQPNLKVVGVHLLTPKPFFVRVVRKLLRIFNFYPIFKEKAQKYRLDFMHYVATSGNSWELPFPYVLSFDDVHHEFYPEHFTQNALTFRKRFYPLYCSGATKIITFSKFARGTIIDKYGVSKDRFRIVYHGKGEEFVPEIDCCLVISVKDKYKLPERFIFYPATTLSHKNHITLLKALHLLAERKFKYNLVLAGNEFFGYQELRDCIANLNLGDQVRWLGPVQNTDMPALYNAASMMIFPSRYEGFGLPLIEAMACGCSVICSNAACLPEIAGGAALLVEPSDEKGMADAIQKVLSDNVLRGELISRGLERAKNFSWENTARGTVEVYQEMAALLKEQELGSHRSIVDR